MTPKLVEKILKAAEILKPDGTIIREIAIDQYYLETQKEASKEYLKLANCKTVTEKEEQASKNKEWLLKYHRDHIDILVKNRNEEHIVLQEIADWNCPPTVSGIKRLIMNDSLEAVKVHNENYQYHLSELIRIGDISLIDMFNLKLEEAEENLRKLDHQITLELKNSNLRNEHIRLILESLGL